ncbi:right origin-binding protein [Klebsiella pneumoniae]|uniref:Right origin-binding protein n=1 Tax=Klebsiella pneumoniae TaxID=573 RepID=A0A2X3FN61_KLEPN|nr:right origin-binding protein [Klebsiella pneumoniae]
MSLSLCPLLSWLGVTQSYTCKLEEISDFRNQMRGPVLARLPRQLTRQSPPVLYGLHEPRPSLEKDDEQEVFYTTALTPEMANGHLQHAHPVTLEGGEYVMFTYEGLGTGLQEFILTVYGTCMPMLNLTRRKGLDIERFYPEDESRDQATPIQLRCEYLIPIRR